MSAASWPYMLVLVMHQKQLLNSLNILSDQEAEPSILYVISER